MHITQLCCQICQKVLKKNRVIHFLLDKPRTHAVLEPSLVPLVAVALLGAQIHQEN